MVTTALGRIAPRQMVVQGADYTNVDYGYDMDEPWGVEGHVEFRFTEGRKTYLVTIVEVDDEGGHGGQRG